MAYIEFIKMNGIGNDFVIIDSRKQEIPLNNELIGIICDRHKGVGCDQLVIIEHSDQADCLVKFYNPDGSEAGACGNATRCVAYLLSEERQSDFIPLQTKAGILECNKISEGIFSVKMGVAKTAWQDIPLTEGADTSNLDISEGCLSNPFAVNIGNPHAVFFVDDVDSIDLKDLGKKLENHKIFPERANIEIVQIISTDEVKLRVWERGAGETLACGSGACAAVFASYKKGLTGDKVKVCLPGGDLQIKVSEDNNIIMTGSVAVNFAGAFNTEKIGK